MHSRPFMNALLACGDASRRDRCRMPKPRWRLILNGKSAGNEPLREAVAAMRERGVALSVRVTWEHGDAERYVAEAIADGVDTVIAAGGDGTLSEVATTLAHRDEPADDLPSLGLVPLGTANDFASRRADPRGSDRGAGAGPRHRRATDRPVADRRRRRDPLVREPRQRRLRHPGHGGDRRRPEEDARRPGLPDHRHRQARPDRADPRATRGPGPAGHSNGAASSSRSASATAARPAAGRRCARTRWSTTACST